MNLDIVPEVQSLLAEVLIEPAAEMLSRPAKKLRCQLVELGYRLSSGDERDELPPAPRMLLEQCSDILEAIHAGSLIIDDIEDQSPERRGKPSLHVSHGLAVALNVGNWLYFSPLDRIASLGLPPQQELVLHRACHRYLALAHSGQALDVGLRMDRLPREQARDACLATMRWKTGALTSLALAAGAAACERLSQDEPRLEEFGFRFGIALQMFDDIGNAVSAREPSKSMEDLSSRKPSWIWMTAATTLSDGHYTRFIELARALASSNRSKASIHEMHAFLVESELASVARNAARSFLKETLEGLRTSFKGREDAIDRAGRLCERLAESYE